MDKRISEEDTQKLEEEISNIYGKTPAEITAIRGRLIAKIKKEIKKIQKKENLSDEEKELIEQLEIRLNDLLHDHRVQIEDRYNKEFIKEKADLKSLITVLPKAVGLAVKKVGTCISELKQAKTNKNKIFKSLNVLKALGMLVATPVIYTVKFILNHWYLILLLLMLLKWPGFKPGKEDGKGEKEPQPQEQEEPAWEEVFEREPELSPIVMPKPEGESVPESSLPQPELPRPHIAPGQKPVIAIDGQEPHIAPEVVPPTIEVTGDAAKTVDDIMQNAPALDEAAQQQAAQVYNDFINHLKNMGQRIIIADQYPNITFVHNAQEFVDYVKSINPYIKITPETALDFYEKNVLTTPVIPEDINVYWINSGAEWDWEYYQTTNDFINKIVSGENEELTFAFNQFANGTSLGDMINGSIGEIATALGISTGGAVAIWALYEVAKWGFGLTTGVPTYALP